MNPETPFTIHGDEAVEARIVAWVLGEASAFESAELERLCEERPELLVFRRRMRALHGLLTEAEAAEPDTTWKLPPEKRAILDEIFGPETVIKLEPEKEFRIRRSGRRAMFATAACLLLTIVVLQLIHPVWIRTQVIREPERHVDFMSSSGSGGGVYADMGQQELNQAIRDQEEKVEEKRKALATIVRTKGIINKGQDSFYAQSGVDEDQGARSALQTYNQLEQEKLQTESQLKSLALKDQRDEKVVELEATLQAQNELATNRLKAVKVMRDDSREEAIKRGLDAQGYVDAKRDFESDQELLQKLRLRQIGQVMTEKTTEDSIVIHEMTPPLKSKTRKTDTDLPVAGSENKEVASNDEQLKGNIDIIGGSSFKLNIKPKHGTEGQKSLPDNRGMIAGDMGYGGRADSSVSDQAHLSDSLAAKESAPPPAPTSPAVVAPPESAPMPAEPASRAHLAYKLDPAASRQPQAEAQRARKQQQLAQSSAPRGGEKRVFAEGASTPPELPESAPLPQLATSDFGEMSSLNSLSGGGLSGGLGGRGSGQGLVNGTGRRTTHQDGVVYSDSDLDGKLANLPPPVSEPQARAASAVAADPFSANSDEGVLAADVGSDGFSSQSEFNNRMADREVQSLQGSERFYSESNAKAKAISASKKLAGTNTYSGETVVNGGGLTFATGELAKAKGNKVQPAMKPPVLAAKDTVEKSLSDPAKSTKHGLSKSSTGKPTRESNKNSGYLSVGGSVVEIDGEIGVNAKPANMGRVTHSASEFAEKENSELTASAAAATDAPANAVTNSSRSGDTKIKLESIDAVLNNPNCVAGGTLAAELDAATVDSKSNQFTSSEPKGFISSGNRMSVDEAMKLREVGKYSEAKQQLEGVLAREPDNADAKREMDYLDDPIRTNPALTYEQTKDVDQVRRGLYMAEGNFNLGKYDESKKSYEEILKKDPNNSAARRGLEKVSQAKSAYYRAAYDQTRAELLSQVDSTWELSVPADSDNKADTRDVSTNEKSTREFKFTTEYEPSTVDKYWDTSSAVKPGDKGRSGGIEDDIHTGYSSEYLFRGKDLSGLAAKEMVRRADTVVESDKLLSDARDDYSKGNYQRAYEKYESALKALPEAPMTKERRDFLTKSLGDTSIALASSAAKEGRSDESRNWYSKALEWVPDNEQARQNLVLDTIEEIPATETPYSTFSLNISDASFQLAKAALAKGERPDPNSIKPEQFYNAVDYGDPAPTANEPVAATVEQSAHPVIPGRNLVRVALRTGSVGHSAAQALRLTLLVDQSGSMVREDRRAAMDHALAQLSGLLTPNDTISVIGFSRTPHLLADALTGDQATKLGEMVNQTACEGGTNLEEAMKLGGQLARRHQLVGAQNRIVLFTDGAANLGDANPDRLATLVKAFRQQGLAFDIAGIGADGLNDRLLSELARNGNGRYYVVGSEANDSFARQLAGAFRPAAENVKVQVNFNPQRVGKYKLIGFEKDRLKTEDFRNDAVDAAELAADEEGVAIYQVEPLTDGSGELGEVSVRFHDVASGEMVERSWTLPYDAKATAFDRATPSMQLAGLSLLAAEKLKGGPLADAIDFKQLNTPQALVKQFYGSSARVADMLQVIEKLK